VTDGQTDAGRGLTYTVRTIPKSNGKFLETETSPMPITHINILILS